jgi:predicted DNA-binding transcriptional regulator AlpA
LHITEIAFCASLKQRWAFSNALPPNEIVFVEWSPLMSEPDNGASNKSAPRQMLNEAQVLQIVPVSRTTLYRMEKAGRFPRSTYISPNRRIWYADQVAAWQEAVDEFDPKRGRGKGRRPRASVGAT